MKEPKFLEININQHVYLQMNEDDYLTWYNHYERLLKSCPKAFTHNMQEYKDRADKKTGLVKMQIHEYIDIFGDKIKSLGRLPCNARMIFDKNEMQTVTN